MNSVFRLKLIVIVIVKTLTNFYQVKMIAIILKYSIQPFKRTKKNAIRQFKDNLKEERL